MCVYRGTKLESIVEGGAVFDDEIKVSFIQHSRIALYKTCVYVCMCVCMRCTAWCCVLIAGVAGQ